MKEKIKTAPTGEKAVYVEVGVWRDGDRIHVATAAASKLVGQKLPGHWYYREGSNEYTTWDAVLRHFDR
jgi:hypothetical protein